MLSSLFVLTFSSAEKVNFYRRQWSILKWYNSIIEIRILDNAKAVVYHDIVDSQFNVFICKKAQIYQIYQHT